MSTTYASIARYFAAQNRNAVITLQLGSRNMKLAQRACRAAATGGQAAKFRALANRLLESNANVALTVREAKLVRRALAMATISATSFGTCAKFNTLTRSVAARLAA